jgi:hypothetical protein
MSGILGIEDPLSASTISLSLFRLLGLINDAQGTVVSGKVTMYRDRRYRLPRLGSRMDDHGISSCIYCTSAQNTRSNRNST